MIQKKTYEELMESYLNRIPAGMDTREGTLINTAMSVTAMSMAQVYEELAIIEENAYGSTATGEMLDKTVEIIGLERLGKINAVVRIEEGEELIVGDVLTGGELKYTVEEVNDGYCIARCNTAGAVGNSYMGEVVPERGGVSGSLKIVSVVVAGSDEEDDESLQRRYLEKVFCPVCTGNVSYYKDAIHSLIGVGGIKIEPAYKGAGTVRVIITDNEYDVAGEDLMKYVKEYLDPEEFSGLGYGVVPIGHSVEVDTVEKVDIEIILSINNGQTDPAIKLAREHLRYELKQLNKKWDTQSNIVIWNRMIEDVVFAISNAVRDVQVISINGEPGRFILGENQIVGEVNVHAG